MVADLFGTTLAVMLGTVAVAWGIGGTAAWWLGRSRFPGSGTLSVLLCLPFVFPPYLTASIYKQIQHAGRLPLPPLENPLGVSVLMGLCLYPWVYLPLKAVWSAESPRYREVGEVLGLSRGRRFLSIHLGLAAPTLMMTGVLVAMEVLSDFGAVTVLGQKTLSVGIHDMFTLQRMDWAAQLSLLSLLPPLLAVGGFAVMWRRSRAIQPPNRSGAPSRPRLRTGTALAVWAGLLLPVAAGFLIPAGILARWAVHQVGRVPLRDLPGQLMDTVHVTAEVTAITLAVSLGFALLLRLRPRLRRWRPAGWLINLNYAIPTVMLAVAVLFLSAGIPAGVADDLLGESTRLLVLAGVLGLICFPFFSIQAGLEGISPRLDELAALLRLRIPGRLWRVYLPLLKKAIACGGLLVLVAMAKELTLSKILQPFGYEALSMRVYAFAGLELLEESALFALALVVLLLYPVVTLDRLIGGREDSC